LQDTVWQELYQAAMVELDRPTLPIRIEIAQAAIERRLQELWAGSDHSDCLAEQQQMADALQGLRTLRKIEFR
jgi:hypothetical protein